MDIYTSCTTKNDHFTGLDMAKKSGIGLLALNSYPGTYLHQTLDTTKLDSKHGSFVQKRNSRAVEIHE